MTDDNMKLWYKKAASVWEEAIPVGNGRMGGMVFGSTGKEHIQFNEDTLWSGYPADYSTHEAEAYLHKARKLIMENRLLEAQSLIKKHILVPFNQSYMPMGSLYLDFKHTGEINEYKRELDLRTAVAKTQFCVNGIEYVKEVFATAVDGIIAVNLKADRPGSISFSASAGSILKHEISAGEKILIMKGKCPSHVDPSYYKGPDPVVYDDDVDNRALTFEARVFFKSCGGKTYSRKNNIIVENADEVTILLAAATSYNGYDKIPGREGKNPSRLCEEFLFNVKDKDYKKIKEQHIKDYANLFGRVELELGPNDKACFPTDERLLNFSKGQEDNGLIALLFQYGRYLMISSSRPGTQPANLQGIWNRELRPPWSSNWTTNINTEMNYWPVEACNMKECHEPLLNMIAELSVTGKRTAGIHYGCRGWTAHHNVDIWRQSTPVGKLSSSDLIVACAFWPMGGAWLCRHLWEHYAFNGDIDYLREKAYPIMKGAALFCKDWLVEDSSGNLITCPSTSPENVFKLSGGEYCGVCSNSTMDISIIRDLFKSCIKAAGILGQDKEFSEELAGIMGRLKDFETGKHGQLMEWGEDYEEADMHHRHLSHLYGLYPGDLIDAKKDELLKEACRKALERRGDGGTGWSLAWKINLWARLMDGDRANKLIKRQLKPVVTTGIDYSNGGGTYPNLFDAHPPFQIDGNFGVTAGIAEMLLQSHNAAIHILPALPSLWKDGCVKGLRARGGYTVDIEWAMGEYVNICITPDFDGKFLLKYKDKAIEVKARKGKKYKFNRDLA